MKNKIGKVKQFINNHKKEFIIGGCIITSSIAIILLRKHINSKENLISLSNEHNEECIVDGIWKPIQNSEGAYYSYAFANDDVKQEFIDLGYKVIEE